MRVATLDHPGAILAAPSWRSRATSFTVDSHSPGVRSIREKKFNQADFLAVLLFDKHTLYISQILLVVRANRCSPVSYLLYPYMQRLRYSLNRLHVRHSIFNVWTVGWMSPDTVLPSNFCQPVLLANHSVPGMSSHFLTYQIIDFYSGVSA